MIDPPTDQPLAALRVQLRGSWSVAEFDAVCGILMIRMRGLLL